MSKPTSDAVNHPSHYGGDTTYEAIKVIEAWELGFCLGNTVKYISRAGKKEPAKTLEDLEKARWYLDREILKLKNTPRVPGLRDLLYDEATGLKTSRPSTLQPPKKGCPNCGEHVACATHANAPAVSGPKTAGGVLYEVMDALLDLTTSNWQGRVEVLATDGRKHRGFLLDIPIGPVDSATTLNIQVDENNVAMVFLGAVAALQKVVE